MDRRGFLRLAAGAAVLATLLTLAQAKGSVAAAQTSSRDRQTGYRTHVGVDKHMTEVTGFTRSQWKTIAGWWSFEAGVLTQSQEALYDQHPIAPEQGIIYLKQSAFSDFTWQMDFKCSPRDTSGPMLLFRCPSNHEGYKLYLPAMSGDIFGNYTVTRLYKVQRGEFPVEICKASAGCGPGPEGWSTVTLTCKGGSIEVRLNGTPLMSLRDATFREGMIGISKGTTEQPILFRNFSVKGKACFGEDAMKFFECPNGYREYRISSSNYGTVYNGFGSVIDTADGRLLCAYRNSHNHVGYPGIVMENEPAFISLTESSDGGKTWSIPRLANPIPFTTGQPQLQRLSDASLIMDTVVYYDHQTKGYRAQVRKREGAIHNVDFAFCRSHDNGKTWTSWEYHDASTGKYVEGGEAIWFVFGRLKELPGGGLLKPAYLFREYDGPEEVQEFVKKRGLKETPPFLRNVSPYAFESAPGVLLSGDGGKTWEGVTAGPLDGSYTAPYIGLYGVTPGDTEPAVEMLPGGRMVMVTRNDSGVPGGICFSEDQGKTWSLPKRTEWQMNCPSLLLTSKGVLLCAHREDGTAIHYSLDYGRTWSRQVRVSQAGLSHTSMVELKDGTVYIVYSDDIGHSRYGDKSQMWGQRLIVDKKGVHPAAWEVY